MTSRRRVQARGSTKKSYRDVAAFLDALGPDHRAIVEALRISIGSGSLQLIEHVKWNSPTYSLHGVDLMTINVRNRDDQVQLVLHRGAGRSEDRTKAPVLEADEGLVRWLSDVRGVITFADVDSVARGGDALRRVIQRWAEIP